MGSANFFWENYDGLGADPFLPVGQHDAVVIGHQLQSRRA